MTSSDRDGNKAVVLLNVSLQDVRAGTQHSLEPRPVQFDTLEGSARNNSGSTGPVHQQGNLTWATQKRQPSQQLTGQSVWTADDRCLSGSPVCLTYRSNQMVRVCRPPQTPRRLAASEALLLSPNSTRDSLKYISQKSAAILKKSKIQMECEPLIIQPSSPTKPPL